MKKILSYVLMFAVVLSCIVTAPTVSAAAETYPELITNGGFDNDIDGWVARNNENCAISQVDGGVSEKALKAERKSLEGGYLDVRTSGKIDLEYFKTYTLTYLAKAADDKLEGKKTYAYIRPIASGTTHQVLPSSIEIHPTGDNTLSTEWKTYTATIYLEYLTDTEVSTELFLRVDSDAVGDSFLLDNVSLKQGEPYRTDLSFVVQRALSDGTDSYVLTPQYTTSVGSYDYSVKNSSGTLVSGGGDEGFITLPKSYFEDSTAYLEYTGTDAFGNETETMNVKLADLVKLPAPVQNSSYVTLQTDNCFWSRGGDELFARFFFENADEETAVHLIAAQYDGDGVLVDAGLTEVTVKKGETASQKLTVSAKEEAVSARFFAFEAGTCRPLTTVAHINKITEGQFIYADAGTEQGGDGTAESPYKTIAEVQTALDAVMKSKNTDPVYVVFSEGEYFTDEPLHLGVPENYKINNQLTDKSASDYYVQKPVTFTAAGADKVVISGGRHISGFKPWENGIYRAAVPSGTQSRQLFVNGIKATRARTEEDPVGFENLDAGATETDFSNNGLVTTDTSYLQMEYPDEVELVFAENFRNMYISPDSVEEQEGKAYFKFSNDSGGNAPAWLEMLLCNTPPTVPVYLENSLSFLDKEGEWYLDTNDNYIYYKPRSFEDIATADVVLPAGEKLMTFVGTPGTPVEDVSVNNLEFAYSAWNTPTENRHFHMWQNTAFWGSRSREINGVAYTYTGVKHPDGGILIDAAIEMKNINNVSIDNCNFNHLGATALKMTGAVQNCDVTGNEFYDISASAVALGDVAVKNVSSEVTDTRINDTADILWNISNPQAENLKIKNNTVSNNYIHRTGTDYFASAALSTGYVINTEIANNELAEGAYSGMHLGWGWDSENYQTLCTEGLRVENNYLHDFMNWRLHDGGAIYTLGRTKDTGSKHSVVSGNYIANVKNRWGGIYFDEGSRNWQCNGNVVDVTSGNTAYSSYTGDDVPQRNKWFNVWTRSIQNIEAKNNYSTTSVMTNKGKDVTVSGTVVCPGGQWNDDALAVISRSGISAEYKSRFAIKKDYLRLPLVMELQVGEKAAVSADSRVFPRETPFDLSRCSLTLSSGNAEIAAVDSSALTVEGRQAGMTWVTLMVKPKTGENADKYYDEITFCVYVK